MKRVIDTSIRGIIKAIERGHIITNICPDGGGEMTAEEMARLTAALCKQKERGLLQCSHGTMNFSANYLDDAACIILSDYLRYDVFYSYVSLDNTKFRDAGAFALARAQYERRLLSPLRINYVLWVTSSLSFKAWFASTYGYEKHLLAESLGCMAGRLLREYVSGRLSY